MKKLLWPSILAVAGAMVWAMLRFAYVPAPQPIMKPTAFADVRMIGAVVFRRFYGAISDDPFVLVGVPPEEPWSRGFVDGFLDAASLEHRPRALVVLESRFPSDIWGEPALPEFRFGDRAAVPLQHRALDGSTDDTIGTDPGGTVYLVPHLFSSGLLRGNLRARLVERLAQPPLSISVQTLPLSLDDDRRINPACLGSEVDTQGTAALGCAVLSIGQQLRKKPREQADQWLALVKQMGPKDFLVLVSPPQTSSSR